MRVGDSHQGTKASKVIYLGDTGRLLSTGFSKFSDRQYGIWSQNDLSTPLALETIDSSSGILFPFYDPDTKMAYIAGKGDGNVRYYEIIDEKPWICFLNQFISGAPQRSFGILPKRGVDTSTCEIFRFYKLHATKDVVEPISMIVPRKSIDTFQEDIYPETSAPTPSLTAEEWSSGKNANPTLMSLKSGTKIRTYKPVVYKPNSGVVISDKNNDKKFMFLSEETKPDYRPMDKRPTLKPSPQIDHRPLGADSYKKQMNIEIIPNKLSIKKDLGSKFQDVQRKWTSPVCTPTTPNNSSSIADTHPNNVLELFDQIYKNTPTSGSNSVKNLKFKFQLPSESNVVTTDLHQLCFYQKQEIDTLKLQVANKDRQITYLEEELKKYRIKDKKEISFTNKTILNGESTA